MRRRKRHVNAKRHIILGSVSQGVNDDEKATSNQYRGAVPGNIGISPIFYAPRDYRRQQGLRIYV